jgi:HSP20 family molecular chaperone IbpA
MPSGVAGVGLLQGAFLMSRMSVFSSPLLLGFDQLEHLLDQATKAGDGYPPYNIERMQDQVSGAEQWHITLAVAGFGLGDLDITVEGRQLAIRGRNSDDGQRDFLHRGIAGRSFMRSFVLAEGMQVRGASLENGLLTVLLTRLAPEKRVQRIEIKER